MRMIAWILGRALAIVLSVLAVFSGSGGVTAAAPTAPSNLHAHTYHATYYDAPAHDTASERGPPAADVSKSASAGKHAVDRGSNGDSARPGTAATRDYTHYGRPGQLANDDHGTGTTNAPHAAGDGDLSTPTVAGVAAKSGDDLVDVWRVVGPDEAAQISKTGSYQVQLGGEGKYFFPTREQAENLGQMYTKQGWGGPQTLTRGQAPRSVIDRAEPVNAGTEGPGWFVRSPDIPSICNVTCVGPVG